MRNVAAASNFRQKGGSEPALMSTTSDLQVAVQYGLSSHVLLFRIHTASFMTRGADVAFLSAFPQEKESVYPPLTFLKPTGRAHDFSFTPDELDIAELTDRSASGRPIQFTIIEVEPQMA